MGGTSGWGLFDDVFDEMDKVNKVDYSVKDILYEVMGSDEQIKDSPQN